MAIAICLDILGAIVFAPLFNVLLVKKNGYKFQLKLETISSILGKNLKMGTLTETGLFIANVLDWIQPSHCIKSINDRV